jgi:hypothetical protein
MRVGALLDLSPQVTNQNWETVAVYTILTLVRRAETAS